MRVWEYGSVGVYEYIVQNILNPTNIFLTT